MKKSLLVLLTAGFGLSLVSCGGGQQQQSATDQALPLAGTRWALIGMNGPVDDSLRADNPDAFTLELVDSVEQVVGCGACNRFFGEYSLNLDTLSIRVSGRTQMFCPGIETENYFLQMLDSVRSYHINADTLRLYDGSNRETALFIACEFEPTSVTAGTPADTLCTEVPADTAALPTL